MTLLDYPGKVACTVFLGGCDFRCPFCHNADILDMGAEAFIQEEEFFSFLKTRTGLLEGVAVTGGEPLLRRDIGQFLEKIKTLGFPVKLDTNGNHPDVLKEIVKAGLVDYVAMDIKNCPERYAETIGLSEDTGDMAFSGKRWNIGAVCESKDYLIKSHEIDYEFRTTFVREFHDEEAVKGIASFIEGAEKYFVQNFTDREGVAFEGLHGFDRPSLETFRDILAGHAASVQIRGL